MAGVMHYVPSSYLQWMLKRGQGLNFGSLRLEPSTLALMLSCYPFMVNRTHAASTSLLLLQLMRYRPQ